MEFSISFEVEDGLSDAQVINMVHKVCRMADQALQTDGVPNMDESHILQHYAATPAGLVTATFNRHS